jgi:hypothetical protein
MDLADFFSRQYISGTDALHFVEVLSKFHRTQGAQACWCLKKANNLKALKGFTTSNLSRPLFKGQDARELVLAVAGQYRPETDSIIVRRGVCTSTHCLNPTHYFYGTKQDVAMQRHARKGSPLSPELVSLLREERKKDRSYASIARQYALPYHVVRRICTNESFS